MLSVSPTHSARLLFYAAWNARTLRHLEFSEDAHPRDDHGRWTDGGAAWPEGLEKVSGAKGSNPGGIYKDDTGQKWYVKEYRNPDQAVGEHIANEVYRAVGVKAPVSALGPNGEYASKWEEGTKTLGSVGVTKENADKVLNGYAADVFVANWDAVGTGHDNILIGKDGSVMRTDQGGALLFRAQGGDKPEAGLHKIGEWNTLADPQRNSYYAKVFQVAGVKNPDALGQRAVHQIDRIVAARPSEGWRSFAAKVAPSASKSTLDKIGSMLEARQKGLEEKRDELKSRHLGDWDEEKHPRDDHGKFSSSDIEPTLSAKKVTANQSTILAVYEKTKQGKMLHHIAAEHNLTVEQVKWINLKIKNQVPQMVKVLGDKNPLKPGGAKPEAPKATEYPLQTPAGWYAVGGKVYSQHGDEVGIVDPSQPGGHVVNSDYNTYGAGIPTENPPHPPGYEWQEKTTGPQAGKYAYFQNGIQVSSPYAKENYKQSIPTLHQGLGPQKPVAIGKLEPAGNKTPGWPISNETPRLAGNVYPEKVAQAGQEWEKVLTQTEKSAISGYTGSGYGSINAVLREKESSTYLVESKIKAIDKALNKAPTPPPPELVWRGISGKHANEFVAGLTNGDTVKMKGFQSTSIRPEFAHSWSGGHVILEIKPAKGGYVKSMSSHPHENEYLLPHGAEYKVHGVASVNLGGHVTKVVQLEMLH